MSSPTTVIARWIRCDTQSAVPLLVEKLRATGNPIGRYSVMIRSLRLPSPTTAAKGSQTSRIGGIEEKKDSKEEGRGMFIVRSNSIIEKAYCFIEDKGASLRSTGMDSGEGQGKEHHRWTFCALNSPNAGPVPFDILLQRVLCIPPNPSVPNLGSWIPRTSHILIEGYTFSVGQTSAVVGDWLIRVGGVQVKGGGAGGRGVVVEATYLPVPYLPANSTFIQDFLMNLFPVPAIAAGEIKFLVISNEELLQTQLVTNQSSIEELQWDESHTAFNYVKNFQLEGLL